MWKIRGKRYDLIPFLDKHPGGRMILTACQGKNDLTATFESNHAFCDMKKIEQIMKKYEVGDCEKSNFTFNKNGFYRTLQTRVIKKLDHYKSNNWWLVKSIIQAHFFLIPFILAFYSNYTFTYRLIYACIAGHMITQFGFGVMHDASHFAVSKNKYINEFLTSSWNAIAFWDAQLWMRHHVYRHHAFTGDLNLDPDVIHFKPFIRKSICEDSSKYWSISKLYPKTIALFTTCIFPGMFIGQGYLYNIIWLFRGFVWKIKLSRLYAFSLWENFLKIILVFSFFYGGSILLFMSYAIMANTTYFACIMPDHDTYETQLNHIDNINSVDWGEIQVRHSGNFATQNPWICNLFGGINYQIEHHLFPTLSHVHFKTIQPIVKKTCREFNIPYVHHNSVFDAISSTLKTYSVVGKCE